MRYMEVYMDPEIPVSRKIPSTIKQLVRTGTISDETMLVALVKKSGTHEFFVFWDDFTGGYVARLVKRTILQIPKRVRYNILIKELPASEENYLRRLVRAELGICHVGGLNALEPKTIPAIIAAF